MKSLLTASVVFLISAADLKYQWCCEKTGGFSITRNILGMEDNSVKIENICYVERNTQCPLGKPCESYTATYPPGEIHSQYLPIDEAAEARRAISRNQCKIEENRSLDERQKIISREIP